LIEFPSYVLNIKGIPYRTVWLDLIDVQSAIKDLGAPSTAEVFGKEFYSIPTIYDPSTGQAVTESQKILEYLEVQYPDSPTLFPRDTRALQVAFIESHYNKWIGILYPLLVTQLYDCCTPESSRVYFRTSRAAYFGKDWEQLEARGKEREKLILEFLQVLKDMTRWIEAAGKGTLFFTGNMISNADVHIASILTWIKRVAGMESDIWNAVAGVSDGRWITFLNAFEKYQVVV
jgi:glutathione S-transferase